MPSANGDRLLFAASARRDLSWSAFRATCDALLPLDLAFVPNMVRARSLAAATGDSLGHWDLVDIDDSSPRICIAPPVLARLPWPGLPRAVLCGARAPDTADAVSAAAAQVGATVVLRSVHPYAPARIEITARDDDHLARLAAALAIPFAAEPPAWSLATASGSLKEYLDTLRWEPHSELTWPRQEFDPARLAFGQLTEGPAGSPDDARLRLVSYRHPAGWTRRDRLIRDGQSAAVDRSWARYAVLAELGKRTLQRDQRAGTITALRQLPLPRLLARALALCSGEPARAAAGDGLGVHIYTGVPDSIADIITTKLEVQLAARDRPAEGAAR